MENKVFGYARVSTSHQNTDRQLEALVEYGVPERDIIVDMQSGKDFNRKGYLSLKENILRKGDTLVVKELDRLGRDKRMIKEELEYFKANGVRVKVLNIPTTLMEIDGNDWILDVRRHIVGGANSTLFSVFLPPRLHSSVGNRRLWAEQPHIVVALFERQVSCF